MEGFIYSVPIWLLCILIFIFRIIDVTIGTIRTLTVVEGRIKISVLLGFIEVFIWITAISQLITRINENFVLVFFYAGGFASGNAIGILIERKIAFGTVIIRIISQTQGEIISQKLRNLGYALTTFTGEGLKGAVTMIFIICKRKKIKQIISEALAIDSRLSYSVERGNIWEQPYRIGKYPSGLRSIFKKK